MSILSNHFQLYKGVDTDIKNNNICDTFTLINPTDDDNYFDWIYLPIDKNTYNTYKTSELYNYMCNYDFHNIADPHRGYEYIDFIKTRLLRYYNISYLYKNLKIKDITDELRSNTLTNIIDTYKNNRDKNYNNLGIIINIKTLLDHNMIFDVDVNRATDILEKNPVGSFIIRSSSCSHLSDDFTVFTITHSFNKNNQKNINNMRYLNIHGIGVYNVGNYDRNYFNNLTKKKFLKDINYKEASYACVMDVIIDLHNTGNLDISKQIFNMP